MSTTTLRAFIGFLVAPGVPALINYIVMLMFYDQWEAAWGSKILVVFGYLAALLIGVPVYFLLQRKGINSLGAYLMLGALIGLVCCALYFIPFVLLNWKSNPEQAFTLLKTAIGFAVPAVISGVVASAVFWLIAIRRTA